MLKEFMDLLRVQNNIVFKVEKNLCGFLIVFKERKAKCQLFDITEDDAGWTKNMTTGDSEQHRD